MRKRELEDDYGAAKDGNGRRMPQGVEQTQSHAMPAVILHAGDIGNGGDVVVVETVMKSKNCRRQKCKVKAVRR